MGGGMGCSAAAAFAVAHPQTTLSLVLYWPVGGAKYRLSSHHRFAEHLAFVTRRGLAEVVALVARDGKPFGGETSAARYLEECLPRAEYFDAPVAAQTEASVAPRLLDFLAGANPTPK